MKNYIANERGNWATSAAYIKYSLSRSIHYGRMYTGAPGKGNEADLAEALRCLGQGLHTLEDFAAHTNYCELALREMGFHSVFPHTGTNTEIMLHGRRVFPLVTGTFGMVDFFHSVLGEATDHFTQSEVNEMDIALGNAQANSSSGSFGVLTGLLGKVPGTRDLVSEAEDLKHLSEAQETSNQSHGSRSGYAHGLDEGMSRSDPNGGGGSGGHSGHLPDFDPNKTIAQIYPILSFRDKVVRKLTTIIEKIPGLEAAVEKISETLTIFIMSLLAPFVRPLINTASNSLQTGSAGVIDASGKHQYEPWTDPSCTDPTHSLLSKDHFANILNEPAGHVAAVIVQYVAPRVLYAWEHTNVHEHMVIEDCLRVFHHPAVRDMHNEVHRTMFEAMQTWVNARPDRGSSLNDILSSEGVKSGKNTGGQPHTHSHGGFSALGGQDHPQQHMPSFHQQPQQPQQPHHSNPLDHLSKLPIPGISNLNKLSNFIPGGLSRHADEPAPSTYTESSYQQHHHYAPPQPSHHGSASSFFFGGDHHHGGYAHAEASGYDGQSQHTGYGYPHQHTGYGHQHQHGWHVPGYDQHLQHQYGGYGSGYGEHGHGHGHGYGYGGYHY